MPRQGRVSPGVGWGGQARSPGGVGGMEGRRAWAATSGRPVDTTGRPVLAASRFAERSRLGGRGLVAQRLARWPGASDR
ncbi:MAG: hypothetical protein J2P19_29920, partial [Pseudonocardia sp.]|nr:hypothetical protein [Pseudonocardia sp.]